MPPVIANRSATPLTISPTRSTAPPKRSPSRSKLFGELKREEKADAQTVKDREKEEKKRTKEEEKLRKKEHEKGPPTDKDED